MFFVLLESISAVITVEGGKVDMLEENEGLFAEAWVRSRRVLAFCHLFLTFGCGHCEMRSWGGPPRGERLVPKVIG